MNISEKAKAVVAAVGAVVTALSPLLTDNVIGMNEVGVLITAVVTAIATAIAVFRVPNKPPTP